MKLEAKAIEGCAEEEYADWIQLHTRREQRWFEIVRYLVRRGGAGRSRRGHVRRAGQAPAPVLAVHRSRLRPAEPTPWEAEIVGLCEDYFRQPRRDHRATSSSSPGRIRPSCVASDHGFGPSRDVFYVNAWLEQQGYLAWAEEDAPSATQAPQIGFSQMTRHVFQLDWSADRRVRGDAQQPGHPHRAARTATRRWPTQTYERLAAEIAAGTPGGPASRDGQPLVRDVQAAEGRVRGTVRGSWLPISRSCSADGAAVSILRSDDARARPERAERQPPSRGHLLRGRPGDPVRGDARRALDPRRRAAAPLQPRRARAARHVGPRFPRRRSSRASWSAGRHASSPVSAATAGPAVEGELEFDADERGDDSEPAACARVRGVARRKEERCRRSR